MPQKIVPVYSFQPTSPPGTYWSAQHLNAGDGYPPLPCNPFEGLVVETLDASNRIFLLHDELVDYVGLDAQMREEALVEAALAQALGVEEMDGNNSEPQAYSFSSEDLWLELVSLTNGAAGQAALLAIHPPAGESNGVFDLFATTNLTLLAAPALCRTNWSWRLRSEVGQTNLVLANLMDDQGYFMLGRTNDDDGDGLTTAFERLVSHTDSGEWDQNNNGIPDGWEWNHFGSLQPDEADYDGDGVSNLAEYNAGTDPNTIAFWLTVTNQYVNTNSVPIWLDVSNGVPASVAVLVDSTNFASTTWVDYSAAGITANLGANDGWHQVRVGLRGRMETSRQTWEQMDLKLDRVPPVLTITNPVEATTSRPIIQLQGYSSERLGAVYFDVTNAPGVLTNAQGFVTRQYFDTNVFEFTTNYFQCFDIELTNGENTIIVRTADLAGNTVTTNITVTLDFSGDTNPPVISLIWPQDGALVSGTNFTLRGRLDDETAEVSAQIVDAGGNTNVLAGLVERGGPCWVENLPLAGGDNSITITTTDAAGNVATTNLTVTKSVVELTINPVDEQSLTQARTTVTGTVSDPGYSVSVNGTQAAADASGNWTAENVRVYGRGTATFDAVASASGQASLTASLAIEIPSYLALVYYEGTYYGSIGPGSHGAPDTFSWTVHYNAGVQDDGNGQSYSTYQHQSIVDSSDYDAIVHVEYSWSDEDPAGQYQGHTTDTSDGGDGNFSGVPSPDTIYGAVPIGSLDEGYTVPPGPTDPGQMFFISHGYARDVDRRWVISGAELIVQVSGTTQYEFRPGGKAALRERVVIAFHVSACEYGRTSDEPVQQTGSVWAYTPLRLIEPGLLNVAGRQVGSDGNLYLAGIAGQPVDATVIAPARHYDALGLVDTHRPRIRASSSLTSDVLDMVQANVEFCVGEHVTFELFFVPPLSYADATCRWRLPEKFVNEAYQYSGVCTSYRRNDDLLTSPTTSCWFTSGAGGNASLWATLHFPNGQYVTTAALGKVAVYRPEIIDFKYYPPTFAVIDTVGGDLSLVLGYAAGSGGMLYKVDVFSKYSGRADYTQIVNASAANGCKLPNTTDGQYWLDKYRFHVEQGSDPEAAPRVTGNHVKPLVFGDNPYVVLCHGIYGNITSIYDQFRDYVVFRPDGTSPADTADNIYVSLGSTIWSFSAATTFVAPSWSTPTYSVDPPSWPDATDDFPRWPKIYNP